MWKKYLTVFATAAAMGFAAAYVDGKYGANLAYKLIGSEA